MEKDKLITEILDNLDEKLEKLEIEEIETIKKQIDDILTPLNIKILRTLH